MKKILFILLAIIFVILVIPFFMKKDFQVEESVTIKKPINEVFTYIRNLKNQSHYSKWAELDTAQINTYFGIDGHVGFVVRWEGNEEVGKGEQEITYIEENKRIDFELRFIEPYETISHAYFTTQQGTDSSSTIVAWGFKEHIGYPMNGLMVVMNLEKMLGEDFKYGLNKLKNILDTSNMQTSNIQ